ncbi:asparagine synthase-related protein [Aureliella helgolandensis]|uniref:Asparagine synthase n=1 Tax=Aureliella helgolandensis TaxID=2527968 RepID=A0A518GD88_9BACT|nr:asparagine synthase-related protein [Aureliella helgolandensis]QDV26561.1 Asparagine synthase [Aureliella helgolandensis]
MNAPQTIERVVDFVDPSHNILLNMSYEEAHARVLSGDAERVGEIDGQFCIVAREGKKVRLARSIGRPLRYFLAKRAAGPCLIIAERIDQIVAALKAEGLANQFHPSYTRMVPAHHILELELVGCPDPNPQLKRFFDPQRECLPANIETIGQQYIGALAEECSRWLDAIDEQQPIGVLFSGGIDSGSLVLVLYHLLLQRGQSPARLKAFTLSVDTDGSGKLSTDAQQALAFLKPLQLEMLLEVIEVPAAAVDWRKAIGVVEDYKPLDIQAATMGLALCQEIRNRYPEWTWLVDGDGGDENLKDYPIEENPELTIRSVLNNQMLYQEGWGVSAIKHSLVFSGGQSRGHVRTFAPANVCGFQGFSPYALPKVIQVAEGIPFIELTDWQHEKLYRLKGEVVSSGVRTLTGIDMPVFEKQRFQKGAGSIEFFDRAFPKEEAAYRSEFLKQFAAV